MVCNACLGWIVWTPGADPVDPRGTTPAEVEVICASKLGKASFLEVLTRFATGA